MQARPSILPAIWATLPLIAEFLSSAFDRRLTTRVLRHRLRAPGTQKWTTGWEVNKKEKGSLRLSVGERAARKKPNTFQQENSALSQILKDFNGFKSYEEILLVI